MTDSLRAFVAAGETVSLDAARTAIRTAMVRYLALPAPDHMLLVAAPPGVGKSFAAVRVAEEFVAAGKRRVLYAGPRHDLWPSIRAMSNDPALWYEWLPRQEGDAHQEETCRYTPEIRAWMTKGHRGMGFCKQICGWEYIANECPYHAQKRRTEPLIYAMHQHVFMGHALQFSALIGDEYPIGAALWPWRIGHAEIVPGEPDPFVQPSPQVALLQLVARLAMAHEHLEGAELLAAMGGAARLREVLDCITIPLDADVMSPALRRPSDALTAPSGHLLPFLRLLDREVTAAAAGGEWLHRIILHGGSLTLLLRRRPAPQMPRHVIWLDATGRADLYEAAFGRPVEVVQPQVERRGRVYQLADRANGKTAMTGAEEQSGNAEQTRALVDRIVRERGYRDVGVITFKDVEQQFSRYRTMHFGAETGNNDLEGTDALFVIGAPLPNLASLRSMATMLHADRMEPWSGEWEQRAVPFPRHWTRENERLGGFWDDPALQAMVWQHREARIIQAAERARLNVRAADVWLLTNIPLAELPPDELLSYGDLVGAPPGVWWWGWLRFAEAATARCLYNEARYGQRNVICRELLEDDTLDLSANTIRLYWRQAEERFRSWRIEERDDRCGTRGSLPTVIDFCDPC